MEHELTLIVRVRRGELNFERLVEVLTTRGYVTDSFPQEEGLSFGRVAIDRANQEDFDALFKVLMPGQLNTVSLMSHGTDRGGQRGCFTTALFNTDVIEYEEMNALLVEMNRKEFEREQRAIE